MTVHLTEEEDLALKAAAAKMPRSGLDPLRAAIEQMMTERLEQTPKVEIHRALDQPTTCRVWVGGILKFDGVDRSVLMRRHMVP